MNDFDGQEPLMLRPDTLAALNEYYQERENRKFNYKFTLDQTEDIFDFEEDWQLSQFWYDNKTIDSLSKVAIKCTSKTAKIGLISCPTLYKALYKTAGERQVKIFEFDKRFSIFEPDFVSYDYNFPHNISKNFCGSFDLIICDPPFLSEECLTKIASTVKFLAKEKIILCTGAVMGSLVERLLNVKKCNFIPNHKNNLANEFWCYSNFNFDLYLK